MKEIFVIKSVEGKPPEITPKKKLQSNPKQYRTLKHEPFLYLLLKTVGQSLVI